MKPGLAYAAVIVLVLILIAVVADRMTKRLTSGERQEQLDGFLPRRVSPCAPGPAPEYGVDMTGRDAAGTVALVPYSRQSRVSLERGADSAGIAEPPNPLVGLDKDLRVRAWRDRRGGDYYRHARNLYELGPNEPGAMQFVGTSHPVIAEGPAGATDPRALADGDMGVMRLAGIRSTGAPHDAHLTLSSAYYPDGYYDAALLNVLDDETEEVF